MLKETGVLYSVQGNGTYIKPFVFTQPLSDFYSFTDTLKSSNILIQNSVIHYDLVKADKSLAIETGYQEGTVFHKLLRQDVSSDAGNHLSPPKPFLDAGHGGALLRLSI